MRKLGKTGEKKTLQFVAHKYLLDQGEKLWSFSGMMIDPTMKVSTLALARRGPLAVRAGGLSALPGQWKE